MVSIGYILQATVLFVSVPDARKFSNRCRQLITKIQLDGLSQQLAQQQKTSLATTLFNMAYYGEIPESYTALVCTRIVHSFDLAADE